MNINDLRRVLAVSLVASVALASCATEPKGDVDGEGKVSIRCTTSSSVVITRAEVECTMPQSDDFALTIEGEKLDAPLSYASMAEVGELTLKSGSYTATVTACDTAVEGYDKAAFIGSQSFTVTARKNTDVEISATIANALVLVEVTDSFKNYFPGGYSLTLKSALGKEFDVTAQSEPLFVAPSSFTIGGTAVKQPAQSGAEGKEVALPEYKGDELKAQTLYTVKFDVEDAGRATLNITLNDTLVESVDIEAELNDYANAN